MHLDQIFSVLGLLAVVLLVLAGAWVFTRWAGQNLGGGLTGPLGGSRIQILDRAVLGRDQSLLLVRAGERYLLLGSTASGLTLLAELSREEGEAWQPPASDRKPGQIPDFRALMQRLKEKK